MSDCILSDDDEALYRKCLEVQVGQSALVEFLQLHDIHQRYYSGFSIPPISSILTPIANTFVRRPWANNPSRPSWNANNATAFGDTPENSGDLGRTQTHLLPHVREKGMDVTSVLRFALLRVSLASCHKVSPQSSSLSGGGSPAYAVFQVMKVEAQGDYLVRPLVGPAITCHSVLVGYMPQPWGSLYPFARHGKKAEKHCEVQADLVSNDAITRSEFKEWLSQVRRGSITGHILPSSVGKTKEKLVECYAKFPGLQPPNGVAEMSMSSFSMKEDPLERKKGRRGMVEEEEEDVVMGQPRSASASLVSEREAEVTREANTAGGGVHLSFSIIEGDEANEHHSGTSTSSSASNSASRSGDEQYIVTADPPGRAGGVVENERRRTTGGSGVLPPAPSHAVPKKGAAPRPSQTGKPTASPLPHNGKHAKEVEPRRSSAAVSSPLQCTPPKKMTKEERFYFFDLIGWKSFQELRMLLHESSVGSPASPNASTTQAADGLFFPRSMIDVGDVGKVRALREDLSAYLQEVTRRIPKFVECVICQSGPATVTIVPCGHTSVCPSCAGKLIHCPMCRGHIDDLIAASDG